jgi:hypothetical protein
MNETTIQTLIGESSLGQKGDALAARPTLPLRADIDRAGHIIRDVRSYKIGDGRETLMELEETVRKSQYNSEDRSFMAAMLARMLTLDQATVDAKAWACRQLWLIGTAAEIPALGNTLKDPALSHMARYALQNMEYPEVDKVLVAALDGTEPGVQIGVINSLAMRKSPGALDAIKPLQKSKDRDVAFAAKHAVGRLEGKIVP